MGRQIIFYMCHNDEEKFMDYVKSKGFRFINGKVSLGENAIFECFGDVKKGFCKLLLYKEIYGDLRFRDYAEINTRLYDETYSPVIEYCPTTVNLRKKTIRRGRIWISNENICSDEMKKEQLKKDYQQLERWIRKNVSKKNVNYISRPYENVIYEKCTSEYISLSLLKFIQENELMLI